MGDVPTSEQRGRAAWAQMASKVPKPGIVVMEMVVLAFIVGMPSEAREVVGSQLCLLMYPRAPSGAMMLCTGSPTPLAPAESQV